ncbi:unnamed protein product [Mytilus edulis]|uniref:Uncharacterized protein n=1 Tax=Mytilus edulis TaxID=6550 RepID=A0A8S3U3Z9_MYTED|nr:unnamed protein product [Mytilus edulis]
MGKKMDSIKCWLENHQEDTVKLEGIDVPVDSRVLSKYMSPLTAVRSSKSETPIYISDDDSDTESEMNYKLNSKATSAEEKQFMVSESALSELLSVCRYCSGEAVALIKNTKGSMVVTNTVCLKGHVSIWKSQSCHNNLPWGNLMTATAILCSGSNSSKVLQMFQHLNMQTISSRTLQQTTDFVYISICIYGLGCRADSTSLIPRDDKEVIVGGDARCDSPGYSAKYGSYTMMDLETSKILDFQLVQAFFNQKFRPSTEQDRTNHLFDVWHVAKGISKKLEAAAKKSGSKDIRPWIKSIVNHIYWISSFCGTNGDLKLANGGPLFSSIQETKGHCGKQVPNGRCTQVITCLPDIFSKGVPFLGEPLLPKKHPLLLPNNACKFM